MFKKLTSAAVGITLLALLVSPAFAFGTDRAVTTADWLNFRTAPNMSGRVIDLIPEGSEVEIVEDLGAWCLVRWNGRAGYVSTQYLMEMTAAEPAEETEAPAAEVLTQETEDREEYGIVTGDEVRFRMEPSLVSDIYGFFFHGNIVSVLDRDGDWLRIEFCGEEGYISAQYVDITVPTEKEWDAAENAYFLKVVSVSAPQQSAPQTAPVPQPSPEPGKQETADPGPAAEAPATVKEPETPAAPVCTAEDIIASAKKCLGVPYVYGGTSLKGFDCSGFTSYVFAQNGITLSRTASGQFKQGVNVSRDELKPGDLVFFSNDGGYSVGHVGIYIGNGQLIHASSGAHQMIVVADMSSVYFSTNYFGARRILN